MTVSLVLVTFRSGVEAAAAVDSFRREAAAARLRLEVIVVDHSEDAGEADRLRGIGPDRLLLRHNRGYAAGINVGTAEATGEVVVVANPDLRLHSGSLAALTAALEAPRSIVGPQFCFAGFLFPPADVQTPAEELRRWRALGSPRAWRRYAEREIRRCLAVWEAAEPVAVPTLSGAMLAFTRETLREVGPWDEDYFLYFEETDWLRRARRAGCTAAVVPGAVVEHSWGHAAGGETATRHFADSRRRYFARHFGLVGRMAARLPDRARAVAPGRPPERIERDRVLWLASPSPHGFPAAGRIGDGRRPDGALGRFARHPRHGDLTVVAADPGSGRLLGSWRWAPDA